MVTEPTREELEAAHCWEREDDVPGRPAMTAFRRRMRLHQARWRASHHLPIGAQPIGTAAGRKARPVGSRIALTFAEETGANFVTAAARNAVNARLAAKEPHQSLARNQLLADLLSSQALGFNLFGDLAPDPERATRALREWWPDTPGTVRTVRFVHSPGWLDTAYLGNLMRFDAVFELEDPPGIVAIDTKLHERLKREVPKPQNLPRYLDVARRAGVLGPAAIDAVHGSDVLVTALEHLLLFSMLQHPEQPWESGRYVVVRPTENADMAEATERYRSMLVNDSTFASITIEALLRASALPTATVRALRDRYVLRG
jgi:hypothetical protein